MPNNVNRSKCLNIICKYDIEYNESDIEEIKKQIEKKRLLCLLKNWDLIDSTRIIEVTNKLFIVKFDLEENEKLAKDLNNLFFIKRVGERRVKKKKKWTWLCDGKLICYL